MISEYRGVNISAVEFCFLFILFILFFLLCYLCYYHCCCRLKFALYYLILLDSSDNTVLSLNFAHTCTTSTCAGVFFLQH